MRSLFSRGFGSELPFWTCLAFFIIVGLTGGASRTDPQSLLILRPLSILVCALAVLTLQWSLVGARKALIWGWIAIFALALLHLVPLPPALWDIVPGRQDLAQSDSLTGLGSVWRPLTITPINGWHALASLFTPLAVLLLAVQMKRDDLLRLLPVLIIFGGVSGLLGILQVIGSPTGPLYLYRITNNGSAVGLFANRNHAALLLSLLFPMLAAWASLAGGDRIEARRRLLLAMGMGLVLLPLIAVTGSRSGLLLSVVGIASTPLIYGFQFRRNGQQQVNWRLVGVTALAIGAIALFGWTMLHFSRAESMRRLLAQSPESDSRIDYWMTCAPMFWKYFPFGSGLGSFTEAYEMAEPASMLSPYYLNHAHNDLIETGVTLGLPGLALILIAILFFLRRACAVLFRGDSARRSVKIARMASVVIAMICAASLSDYPLRTPIMMCILAVMSVWLIETGRDDGVQPPYPKRRAEA